MNVGLFGGSFDPIHLGHLRCAEELSELLNLDTVIFIPAARQPLKNGWNVLPFHHRAAMVDRAIAGNPAFSFSDREYHRKGPSYSIDTVTAFLEEGSADADYYFIMGQDAFQDITLWKDWRELLRLCNIVVMTRGGFRERTPRDILPQEIRTEFEYDGGKGCFRATTGGAVFFRRTSLFEISSRDIRKRRTDGRSIRYLVPGAVLAYIERERLYIGTERDPGNGPP